MINERYIVSSTSEYSEVFDTVTKETVYANVNKQRCEAYASKLNKRGI